MTDQEIEKLRGKLGSDYSVNRLNGAITVELVDIWNGVEFAEVTCESNGFVTKGKIYRIYDLYSDCFCIINDKGEDGGILHKSSAKPSTESAYVEQLKAKAHELFGEIKDGDRFELENGFPNSYQFTKYGDSIFSYNRDLDKLTFGGYTLYKQGKWAKKVEEQIRVKISAWDFGRSNDMHFRLSINKQRSLGFDWDHNELANHIEEAIEAYLNKQ